MEIPEAWEDLDTEWAEQDTNGIPAQILLGADQAILFPHCVKDENGSLVQTESCRLM